MKTIKWLFVAIVSILLMGVSLLVTQRVLLYIGTQQLVQSLQELKKIARQQLYHSQCREIGRLYGVELTKTQFQLRFTSDTEYLTEVVCPVAEDQPILIGKYHLPRGVSKRPGSSGFIIDAESGQVELASGQQLIEEFGQYFPKIARMFEKFEQVNLVGDQITTGKKPIINPVEPVATCQGYGFNCCAAYTQAGIGEHKPAIDCAEHCYPACQDLPAVLSLTAFPNFEPTTRTVNISNGERVDFWTVANDDQVTQTIDFGDGNTFTNSVKEQPISHQYWCQAANCRLTVNVTLEDAQGNKSVTSPTSQITVQIIN